MKQFTDLYVGELSEFRVINKAQRRKIALRMKRLTKSAAFKKKVARSKFRIASPEKQKVKAAKLAKDGQTYIILGSLYLSEDKLEEAVSAIEEGLKKGKVKNPSLARLTLGQAHFELQNFDQAKKYAPTHLVIGTAPQGCRLDNKSLIEIE